MYFKHNLGWCIEQYHQLFAYLKDQPILFRISIVFYLLGPFFMLIERSPADAWISLCGIGFLIHCVRYRYWQWTRLFWVRAIAVFWLFCLLSASVSALPLYSLGEAVAWVRFPVFAFASCFWLARDRRVLTAMLVSLGLAVMMMVAILLAEFFIIGQHYGRLSWPYGDLVPGNFIAKAGLPIFCIFVAIAISGKKQQAIPAAIITLLIMVVSILAGERINFIIIATAGCLAGLVYKPNILRYLIFIVVKMIIIMNLFFSTNVSERFSESFVKHLPHQENSAYKRVWNGAIDAFETAPIMGIGPDNYRQLCDIISAQATDVSCHNHPHNFYLQIVSETGIIGLVLAMIMFGAIMFQSMRIGLGNKTHIACVTSFIIPAAFFFPIQSTADFFGQWNNIFMWSALALALSYANFKLAPSDSTRDEPI